MSATIVPTQDLSAQADGGEIAQPAASFFIIAPSVSDSSSIRLKAHQVVHTWSPLRVTNAAQTNKVKFNLLDERTLRAPILCAKQGWRSAVFRKQA
jgi:hypothetical protein